MRRGPPPEGGAGGRGADLAGVQVGGVPHAAGVVAVVALLDDGIHQLGKHLPEKTSTDISYWESASSAPTGFKQETSGSVSSSSSFRKLMFFT